MLLYLQAGWGAGPQPWEGHWGLAVALKVGPLPRRRGSALAHGCGRGGRVALPLAKAAAVSTRLRIRAEQPLYGRG